MCTDIVTCRLSDTIGDVKDRLKAAGQRQCIVTSEDGVVLGRLRGRALEGDPDASVETVMESGPSTIRPAVSLGEFTKQMWAEEHANEQRHREWVWSDVRFWDEVYFDITEEEWAARG